MHEFDVIARYFRPLSEGRDPFENDAAVLSVPADQDLIVTSDTLNEGTHFIKNADPADIAHKALRVNLSDLAAMGAKPYAYQLNIAFSEKPDEIWLEEFTASLLADQKEFGIFCSGGDTTSINGPLSISITVMGFAPKGQALKRSGTKPGDHIVLTGPVGDALIGLHVLQDKIKTADDDYFINAYYRPVPRTAVSEIVRAHASATVDISDGLAADLGHICKASNCAGHVRLARGIFSEAALKTNVSAADLLTGGDDYELLLAVPPSQSRELMTKLEAQGLKPLIIGEFKVGHGVTIYDEHGEILPLPKAGWQHF